MADVYAAVYAILVADATVTGLIGTRCYPVDVPESGDYPAIRLQLVSAQRPSAMGVDTGDVLARVQMDSMAKTVAAATALRSAARAVVQRFRGTAGGVVIQDIMVENELDLPYVDQAVLHVCVLDLMIAYKEA